jgi:hypothetical protein
MIEAMQALSDEDLEAFKRILGKFAGRGGPAPKADSQ